MDERDYKAMNEQLRKENENSVFDKSLFDTIDIKKVEYVIGVDTHNKNWLSYCLGRRIDGVFETLISRTMSDESDFNEEVGYLAKYFNAEIISDK